MKLSNDYENKLLDLFRGYSIAAPTEFYVGLLDDSGSELTAASYSRFQIDATANVWFSTQETVDEQSNGNTGTIKNVPTFTWGTALENWGSVSVVRFFLTPGGNEYFCDHTVTPLTISNGDTVSILATEFVITTRND